jgi:hypothetical protein
MTPTISCAGNERKLTPCGYLAKANGPPTSSWDGRMARKGNGASAKRNVRLLPVIEDIQAGGLTPPQQIADGAALRLLEAGRAQRSKSGVS